MREEPLKRSYQDTIRSIQSDISSVLTLFGSHLKVWDDFRATGCWSAHADVESTRSIEALLPLVGESPLKRLFLTTRNDMLTRIGILRSLQSQLGEMSIWHINELASNKDQQEAAITAFAFVTILFTPLSWLCGVFGMNNTDTRDLPYGSWLYWILVVPIVGVTFFVRPGLRVLEA